jgi:hypothetical protein
MLLTIAIIVVIIIIVRATKKRTPTKSSTYQQPSNNEVTELPEMREDESAIEYFERLTDEQKGFLLDHMDLDDTEPSEDNDLKDMNNVESDEPFIPAPDIFTPTDDQIARKNRSIDYCKQHEVPFINHLPYYPSEEETTLRSQEEIINRMMALFYFVFIAEGSNVEELNGFDEAFQASQHLSPKEKAFIASDDRTELETVSAVWRYESLFVLLWALGFEDELDYPSGMCNPPEMIKMIIAEGRAGIEEKAQLRSKVTLLDQADLAYRLHWACVNAKIKGEPSPADLNKSTVWERRYALNWLIAYDDTGWDDVRLDT